MIRHTFAAGIAAFVLLAAGTASADAAETRVDGTASYDEPVLLPRHAVFEAVLEDVSRADAPAVELGRVEIIDPGTPPYNFSIGFDREAIDSRRIYAVRAAIRIDGRLAFASDTFNPVLTRGAPEVAEVGLVRVGPAAAPGLGRSRSVGLVALAATRPMARAAQVAQAAADPVAAPQLRGFITFMAEAARFTDCATGMEYRVTEAGE
jgi:putative lipoprotein